MASVESQKSWFDVICGYCLTLCGLKWGPASMQLLPRSEFWWTWNPCGPEVNPDKNPEMVKSDSGSCWRNFTSPQIPLGLLSLEILTTISATNKYSKVSCCVFNPVFGFCALQTLFEICFFHAHCMFSKVLMQKWQKIGWKWAFFILHLYMCHYI